MSDEKLWRRFLWWRGPLKSGECEDCGEKKEVRFVRLVKDDLHMCKECILHRAGIIRASRS